MSSFFNTTISADTGETPATGVPIRPPGRPNAISERRYQTRLRAFAEVIRKLLSRLEFPPSSRGWGYVLEGERFIDKGDLDKAQEKINECRKDGTLPLDVCSEDERRSAYGVERLDGSVPEEIGAWVNTLIHAADSYTPISFWDDKQYYIEMAVEKVDLRHLFAPVCQAFRIPITNFAGWTDLHSRAAMMQRFAEHEDAGRQCVLLYAGDHDPGGLNISEFLRSNFEEMANAVGWHPHNLIIDRFGLDYDFIEKIGLVWINNLETGSGKSLADPQHKDHKKNYVQNYPKQFGARKVEANALIVQPEEGRNLCLRAILKYLPASAPEDYEQRLKPLRKTLRVTLTERFLL
jgi:hypothetical protein